MPLTQLAPPYPIFTDKNGDPLDAGYLYFGVVNLNPETNPIQVYYDSALTQPAAQPLRTSNGYVMRNGSPALLFAGSQFSVTVRDKSNSLVIYSPVGYGIDPASVAGSVIYDDFTGDGVTTIFTLTASPSTKNATNVYIDGIYQSKDNYNTVGSTLTFTTAPPLLSSIEVVSQETAVIGGASSQQISYNQGGTGAVNRTVQARLRDYVSVADFGAVGDGVTDDTDAIQAALNATAGTGLTVYIPNTAANTYIISGRTSLLCLSIPSNTRLVIAPGVTIQAAPGIGPVVRMLSIAVVSNVYISGYGATIKGIKSEYVSGEQRHGVIISTASNVHIEGLTCKDTGGDGFYIGASTGENVSLVDCIADNNRRNGVSITSGKRVLVDRCYFINQSGTDPQSGIDIEPNGNSDFMEDITVRNCYAYNNTNLGYIVGINALPGAVEKNVNVTFLNCVDDGGSGIGGYQVGPVNVGANKISGKISFINCLSRNSRDAGFSVRNYDVNSAPILFEDCTAINPTRTGVVTAQRYNAPFTLFSESADTGASQIGNIHIIRPTIRYTGTPPDVVDFHFRALGAGQTATECYVDSPLEVGHPGDANKAWQIGIINSTNIGINDPREFYTHLGTELFNPASAGTTFKNSSGAAIFTLGARAVGYPDQTFEVTDVGGITITPDAGSAILPLGTTGQSANSTQIGASLTIRRDSATTWRIIRQVGTWTAV